MLPQYYDYYIYGDVWVHMVMAFFEAANMFVMKRSA